MATGHKLGLTPTLFVLLILGGVLTIIGVVVWLRVAQKSVPTQPGQPKSGSSLQLPHSHRPNRGETTSVVC